MMRSYPVTSPVLWLVILIAAQFVATADLKASDASAAAAGGVESLVGAVERRQSDSGSILQLDDDVESLVTPSHRLLRNSYVRFGRTVPLQQQETEAETETDIDKRNKHYVRFGRRADNAAGGRHYVRFGRSVGQEEELEGVEDKRSASKHYVRFGRADGRHYVRFGRSFDVAADDDNDDVPAAAAEDVVEVDEDDGDEVELADKRSGGGAASGKHYVRFGRSVDDALAVAEVKRATSGAAAGKHYVRFGRRQALQAAGLDRRSGASGKHYVRFGRSGPQQVEAVEDGLTRDSEVDSGEVDKRSGGKHYVRFGRSPSQLGEQPLQLDSAVDKRSKHYVRFGRAGGRQEAVDEALAAAISDVDKRANYVRFG